MTTTSFAFICSEKVKLSAEQKGQAATQIEAAPMISTALTQVSTRFVDPFDTCSTPFSFRVNIRNLARTDGIPGSELVSCSSHYRQLAETV